jgi:hypothetical protein
VFKNRVLRKIFGPKRVEMVGGWKRLHNEELHNLYISPNIIRVIESRRVKWTGHVAYIREVRIAHKFLVEKPEGRKPLGTLYADGRIILEWFLEKHGGKLWTGIFCFRTGTIGWLL